MNLIKSFPISDSSRSLDENSGYFLSLYAKKIWYQKPFVVIFRLDYEDDVSRVSPSTLLARLVYEDDVWSVSPSSFPATILFETNFFSNRLFLIPNLINKINTFSNGQHNYW